MMIISGSSGSCFKENILVDKRLLESKLLIERKNSIKKIKPQPELNTDYEFKRYLQSLTFTLKYKKNKSIKNFEGILKFKKDPKPEEIKIDKILEKDLIIRSRWILGIVLFEENFYEIFFKNLEKTTQLDNILNKYYIMMEILFLLLFWIFFIFVQTMYDLKISVLNHFLIGIFCNIPLNLEIFILILNQYIASKFEFKSLPYAIKKKKKFSIIDDNNKFENLKNLKSMNYKKPALSFTSKTLDYKKIYKIVNPKILTNLGNLGSVAFTKNNFLTQKKIEIKSIYYKDTYYSIEYFKREDSFEIEKFEMNSMESLLNQNKKKLEGARRTPKKKLDSPIIIKKNLSDQKKNSFTNINKKNNFFKKIIEDGNKNENLQETKKELIKLEINNAENKNLKTESPKNIIKNLQKQESEIQISQIKSPKDQKKKISPNKILKTPSKKKKSKEEKTDNKKNFFQKYKNQNKSNKNQKLFLQKKKKIPTIILKIKRNCSNDFLIKKIPNLKEILMNFIPNDPSFLYSTSKQNDIHSYSYKDQAFIDFKKNFNVHISNVRYINAVAGFSIVNKGFGIKNKKNVFIVPVKNEESFLKFYLVENSGVTLVVKLHKISDLPLFLKDKDDLFYLRKIVKKNEVCNLETVIFLKKELNLKDSTFLQNHLKNLKKKSQNPIQFFESACCSNWKNMNLYATFGMKEKVEKKTKLIDNLIEAKIRIVYLSQDNFNNTSNALQPFNILENEKNFFKISFTSEKKGIIIFKEFYKKHQIYFEELNNLKKIKENFKTENLFKHQKFTLLINNCSIKTIIQSPYLFYNLKFLFKFSKSIIGYNFTAENNGLIIDLLKEINPNLSTMAIGSFNKDIEMVKKADVGIQYFHNESYKLFGDIAINDLNFLNDLLFLDSQNFFRNFSIFIYFVFFNSIFLILEIFFYSVYSFDSFVIFPNICLLVEKDFIFYLIGLFMIFNRKEICNKSVKEYKILYQRFNFYQQSQQYLLILDFIEALFLAIFVFFFNKLLFIFNNLELEFFIIYLLVINHLAMLLRSFILYNNKNIGFIIFLMASFIFFIFLIMFNCYLETEFLEISKFLDFLQNKMFYIFLIPNFVFIYFFSFCINYFFRMKKFEVLSKLENDKSTDLIMIKFLKYFFFNIKNFCLPKIIHNVFKLKECIEPLLLNTISPLDQLSKQNQINKFLLTFKTKFITESFRMKNNESFLKKKKLVFLFYSLFICSLIIFGIYDDEKIYTNFISVGFSFCGFLIFLIFNHLKFHLTNFISFLLCIILFVIIISFQDNFKLYLIMNTFFLFFLLNFENLGYPFFLIIFTFITLTNISILYKEFISKDSDISYFFMFLFLILSNIITITIYIRKKIILSKKIFLMKSRLKHKKNYNNELLTFLMPKFVLNKISFDVSEVNMADDAGYVTVIFADICDFDNLIKDYGNEIVGKLDSIYKDFDTMCEKYGAQKIETVGKTYMAVCGLDIVEENLSDTLKSIEKSKRALDLAVSLTNTISNYKDYNGKPMNLKIGIHSGKLMMGVIGYHKPQFSLIGDTVNTTSRLCSTGVKSHIMMSNEFFEQIKDFEFDKEIVFEKRLTFMKGKGDVPVYHLFKKVSKFRNILFHAISNRSSLSMSKVIKDNDFSKLTKLKKYKEKKAGINQMFHLLKRFGRNNFFNLFQNQAISNVRTEKRKKDKKKNKSFISKKTRIKGSIESYNSIIIETGKEIKKNSRKKIELIEEFEFQKIILKGYPNFEIEKNSFYSKFKNYYEINFLYKNQIICFIIIAISIVQLIHIFQDEFLNSFLYKIIFIVKSMIVLLFIFITSFGKYFFKAKYSFILKTIFIIILLTINIQYTLKNSDYLKFKFFLLTEELSIFTFMSFSNLISIKSTFSISLSNIIIKILTITITNLLIISDNKNLINNIYILITCLFLEICLLINKINFSKLKIDYFNNLYLEKQKNTQINDFINRLMPEHIQKILKNPKSKLAEEYKNVIMIFADIVGFTAFSAGKNPKQVVQMILKLFTDFDKECNLLKVFKVYTKGDCYVALGFVDKYNRLPIHEEAYKIVKFGFKMIEIIEKVKKEIKFEGLNMRIGVHTGNIIGGVIGSDIIRFDIYGENVMIANKMESKGVKGRINVSHYTKEILENNYGEFLFEDHGSLNVGKKEVKMHLIESFN